MDEKLDAIWPELKTNPADPPTLECNTPSATVVATVPLQGSTLFATGETLFEGVSNSNLNSFSFFS
jgi:hypothetical protein